MYTPYDQELAKSITAMGMALVRQMKEDVDLLSNRVDNTLSNKGTNMLTFSDLTLAEQVSIAWDRVSTFKNKTNLQIATEIAKKIKASPADVLPFVNDIAGK